MESKGDITVNLHGPSRFDSSKGAVNVARRDVRDAHVAQEINVTFGSGTHLASRGSAYVGG
jgi:hypothetical protein